MLGQTCRRAVLALVVSCTLAGSALAYIPALPISDPAALNLSDSSTISIAWQNPLGSYQGFVSFQLEADIQTNGSTSGALVHFTEATMGPNLTATIPWIAYISCDQNETAASNEWDIFTLARDRGAVSALLYSNTSTSCLLNQHYIQDFEKPLDVFATKSAAVARLLESQYRHTNATFSTYNGDLLNSTFYYNLVNSTLAGQAVRSLNESSFLVGTLTARNSTGNAQATDIPNPSSPSDPSNARSGIPVSMIVLYVVTGLIGTCFLLMLLMGWRRARRHPERYGRADDSGGVGGNNGRPTAAGIAQAMLDTFPVVKFRGRGDGRQGASGREEGMGMGSPKRLDSEVASLHEMPILHARLSADQGHGAGEVNGVRRERAGTTSTIDKDDKEVWIQRASRVASTSASGTATLDGRSRPTSSEYGLSNIHTPPRSLVPMPSMEGVSMDTTAQPDIEEDQDPDTCPICLLEFEEGDDLRVLPCEREHVYHQGCIDPWLLQVSGSCPLCRKDFNAPPVPPHDAPSHAILDMANNSAIELANQSATSSTPLHPSASSAGSAGGFARYIATMRDRARNKARLGRGRRRAGTAGTMGTVGSGTSVPAGAGLGAGAGAVGYSAEQLQGQHLQGTGTSVRHMASTGDMRGRSRDGSMVFGSGLGSGSGAGPVSARDEEEPQSIVWGTPVHAHRRPSLEESR